MIKKRLNSNAEQPTERDMKNKRTQPESLEIQEPSVVSWSLEEDQSSESSDYDNGFDSYGTQNRPDLMKPTENFFHEMPHKVHQPDLCKIDCVDHEEARTRVREKIDEVEDIIHRILCNSITSTSIRHMENLPLKGPAFISEMHNIPFISPDPGTALSASLSLSPSCLSSLKPQSQYRILPLPEEEEEDCTIICLTDGSKSIKSHGEIRTAAGSESRASLSRTQQKPSTIPNNPTVVEAKNRLSANEKLTFEQNVSNKHGIRDQSISASEDYPYHAISKKAILEKMEKAEESQDINFYHSLRKTGGGNDQKIDFRRREAFDEQDEKHISSTEMTRETDLSFKKEEADFDMKAIVQTKSCYTEAGCSGNLEDPKTDIEDDKPRGSREFVTKDNEDLSKNEPIQDIFVEESEIGEPSGVTQTESVDKENKTSIVKSTNKEIMKSFRDWSEKRPLEDLTDLTNNEISTGSQQDSEGNSQETKDGETKQILFIDSNDRSLTNKTVCSSDPTASTITDLATLSDNATISAELSHDAKSIKDAFNVISGEAELDKPSPFQRTYFETEGGISEDLELNETKEHSSNSSKDSERELVAVHNNEMGIQRVGEINGDREDTVFKSTETRKVVKDKSIQLSSIFTGLLNPKKASEDNKIQERQPNPGKECISGQLMKDEVKVDFLEQFTQFLHKGEGKRKHESIASIEQSPVIQDTLDNSRDQFSACSEKTQKSANPETALDVLKAFFTVKSTKNDSSNRKDPIAQKRKINKDKDAIRAFFDRTAKFPDSKEATETKTEGIDEHIPKRLQTVWPPPKPKDEEEKIRLKYTEADHQAALLQLKREFNEEVEKLQSDFRLEIFRLQEKNEQDLSQLCATIAGLHRDKNKVAHKDHRDAAVSTEECVKPWAFHSVYVQTDKEVFVEHENSKATHAENPLNNSDLDNSTKSVTHKQKTVLHSSLLQPDSFHVEMTSRRNTPQQCSPSPSCLSAQTLDQDLNVTPTSSPPLPTRLLKPPFGAQSAQIIPCPQKILQYIPLPPPLPIHHTITPPPTPPILNSNPPPPPIHNYIPAQPPPSLNSILPQSPSPIPPPTPILNSISPPPPTPILNSIPPPPPPILNSISPPPPPPSLNSILPQSPSPIPPPTSILNSISPPPPPPSLNSILPPSPPPILNSIPPPPPPPILNSIPPPPPPPLLNSIPPPPPPPILNSIPPPPSVVSIFHSKKEEGHRKPTLEPLYPMKPLYWARIQIYDNRNNMLWGVLKEPEINTNEFAELFAKDTLSTKRKPLSAANEKAKTKKVVKLLDGKRSQAVGILISSLHLDMQDIQQAVLNLDSSVVDLDAIEALYENRAQPEELEKIKKHYETSDEEQVKLLDKPEQFLYELSQIPEFSSRVHCFIFQSKFTDTIVTIQRKTEIILRVCKFLLEKDSVRAVMGLVLALGNYMNGGSRARGQADGFGLEILPKLKDVKSRGNKMSLLDYIVYYYLHHDDEFDDLSKDLKKLSIELTACKKDALTVCTSSSPEHIHPFKEKIDIFIGNDKPDILQSWGMSSTCPFGDLISVCDSLPVQDSCFSYLVEYFGLQPRCGEKENHVFTIWFEFCNDFKVRWKRENKAISKQRIKEAKQSVRSMTAEKKIETRRADANGLKERLRLKEESLISS
ncbi:hypothetical protein DNTS_011343 [Danionella cerebrum]|uniref:FH2 domain-containing protein n=1 Tax=Danionella cerebrum TaxID=2873325 RepID=A0A553MS11_9TELE|nr:hypothetical protein DNTS_011343 [Danionella translucida]